LAGGLQGGVIPPSTELTNFLLNRHAKGLHTPSAANHNHAEGMTMTTNNYDISTLKSQVFRVSDELHTLYDSYESLQVLSSGDSGDSRHVAAVICGLNYRFEVLLLELDKLYQKHEKKGLTVVRDSGDV
jgi:hypothetical protein